MGTRSACVVVDVGSRGDVEPLAGLAVRLRAIGADVRVCPPPDEERLAGARPVAETLGIRYGYASFQPVTLPSPSHPPPARPGLPFLPGKSSATNDSEGSGE